jgi:putative serine protease PepD
MSPSRRGAALSAAGALAILALGAGAGAGLYAAIAPETTTTVVSGVAPTSGQAEPTAVGPGNAINALYERSYRGVVDITARSGSSANPAGFRGGPSLEAEGSGFMIDDRGDIVTNDHVVLGATSITVTLWNGRTFAGTLVGSDESTDLAVLRISAPSSLVHPLAFADSDAVAIGDPVIAIGSPFGLAETVTNGIVSALHRSIDSPNNYTIGDAIQTDAPINHGNSGGPLIDAAGQVIGVNSQIQTDSGGNEGVAFAIPANTVSAVTARIIAHRSVDHAYMGVEMQDSTSPAGALIEQVLPGTPAARARLEKGDVVTALDGQTVTDESDLAAVIAQKQPGDRLIVTFLRDGKTRTVTLTLATRPA